MRILVTGSAGHLGEALMRTLPGYGHDAVGLDIKPSKFTHAIGSVTDRPFVSRSFRGVQAVVHTATLHKPHVASHARQAFVDTNVMGTLVLLEEALEAGVSCFIFTSTTSTFGRALTPPPGSPAVWIVEGVVPVPRNIYGVTKVAAEDICELVSRDHGLPCIVLRTSRFFPEPDDNPDIRDGYEDANVKVNELLYRRVDIEDVVGAHVCALDKAAAIGFGRYVISATTPFTEDDLAGLRVNAAAVVRRHAPDFENVYAPRGWSMFPTIDRVYINDRARQDLGWRPKYDFARAINLLQAGDDFRSPLARTVGYKGYHADAQQGSVKLAT
jgi:UDP-glucose 4-epimerase